MMDDLFTHVGPLGIALIPKGVDHEVGLEAEGLLHKEAKETDDGRLLEHLGVPRRGIGRARRRKTKLDARRRAKVLVPLDRVC